MFGERLCCARTANHREQGYSTVKSLDGKVAIVTGAASGIGLATAKALAREGASVVVADFNEKGADDVVRVISASGGRAVPIFLDATQEESVREVVRFTRETFGGLHVLHNNVGATDVTTDLDIVNLDLDTWDNTFRICLKSVAMGCKFGIPVMLDSGGGSIVNTASMGAVLGDMSNTAYGVAKAGVMTLTRYVATQYSGRGIRCNAIAPGLIVTPASEALIPAPVMKGYKAETLTPRLGKPEDIAELVAFLASDAAGYITGQTIQAEGGLAVHSPVVSYYE